jgi:hypothetical protein
MAMRSEAEVRKAAEALAWYWASGRVKRQGRDTENNIIGVTAAIEWVLGRGLAKNSPVAGMLMDISEMRQKPGNN